MHITIQALNQLLQSVFCHTAHTHTHTHIHSPPPRSVMDYPPGLWNGEWNSQDDSMGGGVLGMIIHAVMQDNFTAKLAATVLFTAPRSEQNPVSDTMQLRGRSPCLFEPILHPGYISSSERRPLVLWRHTGGPTPRLKLTSFKFKACGNYFFKCQHMLSFFRKRKSLKGMYTVSNSSFVILPFLTDSPK